METEVNTRTSAKVIVVGGGLAGCLASLLLARKGCDVALYERRLDPTTEEGQQAGGRSINLAISTRGLTALAQAELDEQVRQLGVPMYGRCVHDSAGRTKYQPYGTGGQHLLSVPRAALNELLVSACKANNRIKATFGVRCVNVDIAVGKCTFLDADGTKMSDEAELVVGADGMWSRVRTALMRAPGFDYSQEYIAAAYKEIRLDVDKSHPWRQEWLHIWPRKNFMLIALPNQLGAADGAYTCTLFMDRARFDQLDSTEAVERFLFKHFPDAYAAIASCSKTPGRDFLNSPTPPLLTVRCAPHHAGRVVLVGDAAHAIVPFYGQGTQAAFEDARVLAELVGEHGATAHALSMYTDARKRNADAIADLSLDHYADMAARSARPLLMLRRRLGVVFGRVCPGWKPLYTMVAFSNVPYADAVARSRMQERVATGAAAAVFAGVAMVATAWARKASGGSGGSGGP